MPSDYYFSLADSNGHRVKKIMQGLFIIFMFIHTDRRKKGKYNGFHKNIKQH